MRLRITIAATLLIGLALPASSASAGDPARGLRAMRGATMSRNMDVERAQLRQLMSQRQALVAQLAAWDGTRGQALARALLGATDAMLSRDIAALDQTLRDTQTSTPAPAPPIGQAAALTAAGPGLLWSPSARPWSASQLTLALAGAAPTAQRPAVTPPLAMSLADLTSWADLVPQSASTPANEPTATATPAPPRGVGSFYVLPVDAGPAAAPSHGALQADGGSGAAPLAAANPTVAAALAQPDSSVPLSATAPFSIQLPDRATLQARRDAVAAALARVRAVEAWANVNPPTAAITASAVITSPDTLSPLIDQWTASVPLSETTPALSPLPALSTMAPPPLPPELAAQAGGVPSAGAPAGVGTPSARPSPTPGAVPADALGATLALTTGPGTDVAISGTLAQAGTGAIATSAISNTTATDLAANMVDAPVAVAPTATVPLSATATTVAATVTLTATTTPTATANGLTPTVTAIATETPAATTTATSSPTATTSATDTPTTTATSTPTAAVTPGASGVASTTATLTATVAVTPSVPLGVTSTAPITDVAALDLSAEGATPVLTLTTGLSSTAPMTLVATLPISAAQSLTAPAFLQQRGALESVLRQGQTLYAQLQTSESGALQSYRDALNRVAALNNAIEQQWNVRYATYVHYQATYPTYVRRKAAFDAYAHRLHMATMQAQQWQQRMAAWTRYAQQLAAYRAALAACARVPTAPISGTTPLSSTAPVSGTAAGCGTLPPKPVAPPFPGTQPPPFREAPPPWPGLPPLFATNPGPEPSGYALPLPPEPIPAWDGSTPPIADYNFSGTAPGIGAAGREETTLAQLLADGALDGVPSYQDPIKGIITTYWGGQTVFQSFHPGVDIAAPMYTPIHAAAAGVVVYAGYAVPGQRHASYGLCVIIRHNSRFSTLYAHMDDLKYGLMVRTGDTVQQGQVIGYEGLTGWTTGPHLHFEMREDNVQFNPLLLIPNPQD